MSQSMVSSCVEFTAAVVHFGASGFLQSTLLVAFGLAIGWLVRPRGPAVQSAVFRATLASALACPVVSLFLAVIGIPGVDLNLSILPDRAGVRAGEMAATDTAMPREGLPMTAAPVALPSQDPGAPGALVAPSSARDGIADKRIPATREASIAASSPYGPRSLVGVLAAAWFLGTGLLLTRLLFGWRLAASLRRTASPADAHTLEQCRVLAAQLGLRTPPVLRTPFACSPLVLGVLQPVIVLPEEDGDISSREVLAHELAHIARSDAAWRLLAAVGTALWFFQPLMWLLERRLLLSAEEVCDDHVLHFGFDRADYSRRLVAIADQYRATPAMGVGMISLRSWMGRRVVRILDAARPLSLQAGRRVVGSVLVASLAATIFVGSIALGREATAGAPSPPSPEKSAASALQVTLSLERKDLPDPRILRDIVSNIRANYAGLGGVEVTIERTIGNDILPLPAGDAEKPMQTPSGFSFTFRMPDLPIRDTGKILLRDEAVRCDWKGIESAETICYFDQVWTKYSPRVAAAWHYRTDGLPGMMDFDPREIGSEEVKERFADQLGRCKLLEVEQVTDHDGSRLVKCLLETTEGRKRGLRWRCWFDCDRRYLPVKVERLGLDGSAYSATRISYRKVAPDPVWFLSESRTVFMLSGQAVGLRVTAVKIHQDIPDAAFQLQLPAGTEIH